MQNYNKKTKISIILRRGEEERRQYNNEFNNSVY
jgi:hypothetical protein